MYDMAKRSVAFTLATGGLLLAGPACAVAAAAEDAGVPAGSLSAHADAGEPLVAQALGARFATPNGGIGSGNTLNVPIDLGLNLCGNTVSLLAQTSASSCSITSDGPAAGSAALGAPATGRAGLLSNNAVRAPLNLLLNACGNGVAAASSTSGSACAIDRPAGHPGAVGLGSSSRSGALSANSVDLPIFVPVNACGNGLAVLSNTVSQTISCAVAEGLTAQQAGGQSAADAGSAAGAGSAISTGSTTSTGGVTGAGGSGSQTSGGADQPQTATTTTTTTTTVTSTVTSGQSQMSATAQAQASPVSPALSTTPIQVGGIGSDIAGVSAAAPQAAAPHAVAAPAAMQQADQVTVTAQPRVVWPRLEAAAFARAPREVNLPRQQSSPPGEELAHTGAGVIAPFGLAAAVLIGGGAALRATGHHRK